MMQGVEPMTMGSPSTPQSGTPLNQSTFLPSYLMGEASPMVNSPSSRLWSTPSASPPKSSLNKSSIASPSREHSVMFTPKEQRSRESIGVRGKDKSGAPPIQGLLEHITSPISAMDRSKMDLNSSLRINSPANVYSTPGPNLDSSTADMSGVFLSQTKKTPPSPAQRDPFYTQGEQLTAEDDLDDTWITIFGFPAAATSFILQQFSQYGNILKHIVSPEGNWLHIHYQTKLQAKKALSKNGKVFGNSIMVGVNRCIDKNVMNAGVENRLAGNNNIMSTPTQGVQNIGCDSLNTSRLNTSIRPLTAAYKAASNEHDVLNRTNTPQKNNGIISKAMEYMFGW